MMQKDGDARFALGNDSDLAALSTVTTTHVAEATSALSDHQNSRRQFKRIMATVVACFAVWWGVTLWCMWGAERITIDLSKGGKESGIRWPEHRSALDTDIAVRDGFAICTVILPNGNRFTHTVHSVIAGHLNGAATSVTLRFPQDRQAAVTKQLRDVLVQFALPTDHFDKWDREYREKGYPPLVLYERSFPTDWGGITVRTGSSYSEMYPWYLEVRFNLPLPPGYEESLKPRVHPEAKQPPGVVLQDVTRSNSSLAKC